MKSSSLFSLVLAFLAIVYVSNALKVDCTDDANLDCSDGFDTGGLSRKAFPQGFQFGTATSAYQVEGMASKDGRGPSIWDPYVQVPGHIKGNATGEVSVDQYHHYKGTGEVNQLGIDYYNRLIDYMLERGITPYANLYHYDMPLALQEKYNGLLRCDVVKDYADYADFCFKTFGDRVKNWFTFNEPRIIAALGFDNGLNPPSRCSKEVGNCTAGDSGTEPYIAAHNMILAHAAAVERYREKYQKEQGGRIGILLDFVWYEPLTRSKADNYAAQRARDFHIGWFLHPITYGEYPRTMQELVKDRLPKFTEAEVQMVKGSIDYVGINVYTGYYMMDPPWPQSNITSYQNDWNVGFSFERHGKPVGPLYVQVFDICKRALWKPNHDSLGKWYGPTRQYTFPEVLHDNIRINYYRDYISSMKKAIDDGANVIGYFAWSLLDNFEWLSGYTSRFGIVYVDYDTLKRYPKMSAYWFQQWLKKD
ncbi:hypothetical protein Patl1_02235 [Pistacia atlantica]|uniref:Uncharacterized protein n=1 Tax=Pistacia atlantica TaxID=434234 RepID=A0ACC1CCV7_9ROSI|nr:hypothetical protein Patl1_02235 [Pistacia atlantica]